MHALPEQTARPDALHHLRAGEGTAGPVPFSPVRNGSSDRGTYDAGMLVAESAAYIRLHDEDRTLHLDVSLPELPVMVTGSLQIMRRALRTVAAAAARCAGRGCLIFHLGVHGSALELSVTGSAHRNAGAGGLSGSTAAAEYSPLQEHPALGHASQQINILGGTLTVFHNRDEGCRYTITLPLGCQEFRRSI